MTTSPPSSSSSDVLQQIVSIHQDHTKTSAEKEELLKTALYGDQEGDLLSFLLQQREASSDSLIAAIQTLERYSHLFIDIIQSPHLVAWVHWLHGYHTSSEKLHTSALTMLKLSWKLNIDHRAIDPHHLVAVAHYALSLIAADSLVVAELASRVVEAVVSRADWNVTSQVLSRLYRDTRNHAPKSVVTVRYVSLGALLSQQSEEVARDCVSRGALPRLAFEICRSDDVLVAINAMDLLTQFSRSAAGLEELCDDAVLDWLIIVGCGDVSSRRPPDPLLEAEALRVLADVFIQASKHSHAFVGKISDGCVHSFLTTVLHYLDDGTEEQRVTALGLLADFSMISSQSLSLLQAFQSGALLTSWLALLNSSKVELSSAALSALVKVFDQPDEQYVRNALPAQSSTSDVRSVFSLPRQSEEEVQVEVEKITSFKRLLFQRIGEVKRVTSLHYLVKAARQPVASLRHAALDLLRAIAQQSAKGWGIRALFNNGYDVAQCEFWLYLKDRTSEHSKEGKDFKFALIEAVTHSPFRDLLGEDVASHLQVMVQQGAYYMPPRLEELETL
mmetsp:Transcript_25391/g.27758  ORF Transcript_25391/g.27758 Transcript_25391/m.27758 type:complete len:560 (+) Transcript_25391:204-1883(+)|eukprot:gene8053-8704_t